MTITAISKPVEAKPIEVYTFLDFVRYGIKNGGNVHNGYPYSFQFLEKYAVTHDSNERYIINVARPATISQPGYPQTGFRPNDVILADAEKNIKIITIEEFLKTHDVE